MTLSPSTLQSFTYNLAFQEATTLATNNQIASEGLPKDLVCWSVISIIHSIQQQLVDKHLQDAELSGK